MVNSACQRTIYSSPPFSTVSLFTISVTCSKLKSKNVQWTFSEINTSSVLNCTPFWVAWWSGRTSVFILPRTWIFLSPSIPCLVVISCQLSYQTACAYHRVTCVQVALVWLNKRRSDDAGNLDEPTRSHEVLPLSGKMKLITS